MPRRAAETQAHEEAEAMNERTPIEVHGVNDEQGPLVRQPAPAARLARILQDPAQMWEEARAIASRILASCPTH